VHNTLLHWETLLVVTTGDLEDVTLEFISDGVSWNLSAHSVVEKLDLRSQCSWCRIYVPLVHEDTELALIFDVDELLTAIGRLY
jgi:hypothetical protein